MRGQGIRPGLCSALVAATGIATAAERPAPVIQVGLDVVRIDVSVTDAKGRPVTDLRPDDFRLLVDGKPRRVENSAFFGREAASGVDAERAGGSGGERSLIFLIDDLNMSLSSMYSARKALKAFAAGWNPEDALVAVRLTSDAPETLRLSRSPSQLDARIDALRYSIRSDKGASSAASENGVDGETSVRIAASVRNPARTRANFDRRIDALIGTIDALRSVPGRKAVILVSEGLAVSSYRERLGIDSPFDRLFADSGTDAALRMIVEVANRASVVVCTMDPSGLVSDWPDASVADAPAPESLSLVSQNRADVQGTLARLASDTGGLAVFNRNDLHRGLVDVVEDQRSYYLIGFEPPDRAFSRSASGEPKFHDIRLAVNRPGARVRTRAGFYGVTDEDVLKGAPLVSVPTAP